MKTTKIAHQTKIEDNSVSKTAKIKTTDSIKNNDFPIVGIGSSAGGLETLGQFFAKMPENTRMAFVIIQHLDPNHVGMMPKLLQRMTPMKVVQVTDCLKVEPNCIYVIPPNKSMSLLNSSLRSFAPVKRHGLRLPIVIYRFKRLRLGKSTLISFVKHKLLMNKKLYNVLFETLAVAKNEKALILLANSYE